MPKRIDIGTDIATIGIWDPTCERHDLKTIKYADYKAALESEAHAARLFFINTGADGAYLTDIYFDDEPDPDCLALYSAVEREFLIESQSGHLIAGGIEDFVSSTKQITSENDQFTVGPGLYALSLHTVDEDKLIGQLRDYLGADDHAYYERKSGGIPWGCLLFVIAAILLLSKLWLVSAGVFALSACCAFIRFCLRAGDHRFQDISTRIAAFEEQFPPPPPLICVLRRVSDAGAVKGGWHDLT